MSDNHFYAFCWALTAATALTLALIVASCETRSTEAKLAAGQCLVGSTWLPCNILEKP